MKTKTKQTNKAPVLLVEQVAELVPPVQVRVLFEGVCAVDFAALAVHVAAGCSCSATTVIAWCKSSGIARGSARTLAMMM